MYACYTSFRFGCNLRMPLPYLVIPDGITKCI
jgi:hypothetical protein